MGNAEIAFRPHAVTFDGPALPDGLELDGVIEDSEFLGEFVRYELRVGSGKVIADQPHRRGEEPRARGERVRLAVPLTEVRVM